MRYAPLQANRCSLYLRCIGPNRTITPTCLRKTFQGYDLVGYRGVCQLSGPGTYQGYFHRSGENNYFCPNSVFLLFVNPTSTPLMYVAEGAQNFLGALRIYPLQQGFPVSHKSDDECSHTSGKPSSTISLPTSTPPSRLQGMLCYASKMKHTDAI